MKDDRQGTDRRGPIPRVLRVRLRAPDREAFGEIDKLGPFDWGGRGPRMDADGRVSGDVFVSPAKYEELKKVTRCTAELIEDATEAGLLRQKEVGRGDRFEGGRRVPRGLGKKG